MAAKHVSSVLSAISVAAALAAANSAFAADLLPTRKAPPAPVVAAPNWGGFYAGVEGGADWMHSSWNTKALGGGVPDGSADTSFSQVGGRFGAYGGYNWMVTPTVLTGVEGDIAGDFFGTKSKNGIPGVLSYYPAGEPISDYVDAKGSSYDGSLRARLGALVTPTTLVYTTGGVAFADPKFTVSCPAGPANSWCATPQSGSTDPTRVGWTVGLGVETMLTGNWLLRAEYRYSGFENKTTTFFPNGDAGFDAITARTKYDTNTVNVGLAYKF